MVRSAFLICVGIIAVACFACAPAPPGPPTQTTAATCDTPTFLGHVKFVPNGFPPPSTDPNTPPSLPPGTVTSIGMPYAQTLQNAFQLAPPRFQTTLCGLTAIYVNGPTTCSKLADCIGNSWGFRVWHPYPQPPETYIAISAGLWNRTCPDGSSYVYHCFETELLNAVFGWDPLNSYAPKHGPANPEADNFDMTILAALAHEVGHVRWYQVITPNSPGVVAYDPNTSTFCGPGSPSFFSYSWNPVGPPPVWRQFAARSGDQHGTPPQISTIDAYVKQGDLGGAAYYLDQLYQESAPWASYFAAISPDEDFVETYKFYILTKAQNLNILLSNNQILSEGHLKSLPTTINGVVKNYYRNIPDDYTKGKKQALTNKTNCIATVI
jgi:hypothetical protein